MPVSFHALLEGRNSLCDLFSRIGVVYRICNLKWL
jgi:hypothetical protein